MNSILLFGSLAVIGRVTTESRIGHGLVGGIRIGTMAAQVCQVIGLSVFFVSFLRSSDHIRICGSLLLYAAVSR